MLFEISGAEYIYGVNAHIDKYVPCVTARGIVQQADQFLTYPFPVVLLQIIAQEH